MSSFFFHFVNINLSWPQAAEAKMVDEIHHESPSRGFWCFGSPALATGILTSLLNGSFAEFRTLVSSRICRWAFLSCLILSLCFSILSHLVSLHCFGILWLPLLQDLPLSLGFLFVPTWMSVLICINYMKRGAKMSVVLQQFACRCFILHLFDYLVWQQSGCKMSSGEVHCGHGQKTFRSKERDLAFFPSYPCVTVCRASLAVEELGLRVIPGMQGEVYSFLVLTLVMGTVVWEE